MNIGIEMKTHKLIFNSEPDSIKLVKDWLDKLAIEYNVCEELYPNILISLTEAVNNAIHHGNKCDANKRILLVCSVKKKKIKFKVMDEGEGFNEKNIPNPLSNERLTLENGRGVMIMKELAHEIRFKKHGSMVEMTFKFKSLQ